MQELAGHASSAITMDIYTHVSMDGKRQAAEKPEKTLQPLAHNLTDEQVDTVMRESAGLTSWVGEAAKKVWEAKHGQDR